MSSSMNCFRVLPCFAASLAKKAHASSLVSIFKVNPPKDDRRKHTLLNRNCLTYYPRHTIDIELRFSMCEQRLHSLHHFGFLALSSEPFRNTAGFFLCITPSSNIDRGP